MPLCCTCHPHQSQLIKGASFSNETGSESIYILWGESATHPLHTDESFIYRLDDFCIDIYIYLCIEKLTKFCFQPWVHVSYPSQNSIYFFPAPGESLSFMEITFKTRIYFRLSEFTIFGGSLMRDLLSLIHSSCSFTVGTIVSLFYSSFHRSFISLTSKYDRNCVA